jgi:hypothetical protein
MLGTTSMFVLIGAILFELVRTTESILEIRQERRQHGDDPKVYL